MTIIEKEVAVVVPAQNTDSATAFLFVFILLALGVVGYIVYSNNVFQPPSSSTVIERTSNTTVQVPSAAPVSAPVAPVAPAAPVEAPASAPAQ